MPSRENPHPDPLSPRRLFDPDYRKRETSAIVPAIVLAAAFVFMLAWTWNGWTDPLVDFGRELYVPWRIVEGDVLYRDIAYFNGPLSPHFNALLMRVFGVSLRTIQIVNIALFAGLVYMTYRLLELAGTDRLGATLACLLQIGVFGFLQYSPIGNYNFITPYSHELTHGVVLSFAAMLCVSKFATSGRAGWIVTCGLLVGCTFLTKPEVFVALAPAIVVALLLAIRPLAASRAQVLRFVLVFAGCALIPVLCVWLLLMINLPALESLLAILGAWIYLFDPRINQMKFYQGVFGSTDIATSLHAVIVQSIWYAAIGAVVCAIAFTVPSRARRSAGVMIGSTIAMVAALVALDRFGDVPWQVAFRGLVAVMIALVIATAVWVARKWKNRVEPRAVVRAMLCVFALLLLGKVFFNVLLYHYGFALAMPAAVVTIAAIASWGPTILDKRGASGNVARGAAIALVGFLLFIHLRVYATVFADKPLRIGTGPDQFRTGDAYGRDHSVKMMLEAIDALPAGATLATVPEGVMLNYLSRRVNSTPFINLMPPEVVMFGQQRIGRAFEINPPDYIVLVLRSDPADYCFKSFAADYGKDIYRWIEQNYRQVPVPTDPRYPMVLLERVTTETPMLKSQ